MDLGGTDLRVGTRGLKLPIPQFALDFDEGALLERAGPFAEFPPNHDSVPLGPGLVFTGIFVFPTHVGRDGKPGVRGAVGREASLGVLAESGFRGMAISVPK